MKVLFVGAGSIAKRHIQNINELFGRKVLIDIYRHSKKPLDLKVMEFINKEIHSFDELTCKYDGIFITNPTKLHLQSLKDFNDFSDNFFIEKPLIDISQSDEDLTFLKNGKTYYVACPLRHSKIIKYLKENLDTSKINSVLTICSSYLPDWHPDKDYRTSYSAKKSLGGGVSIDLIHEWDYIYYLLGKPEKTYSILDKVSSLEIDTEDIAIYIAKYKNMTLELHVDYLGKYPIRKITFITEEDTIIADILENTITYTIKGEKIDLGESRNDYQKEEIKYFFKLINSETKNINDIKTALNVLKLTQGEL